MAKGVTSNTHLGEDARNRLYDALFIKKDKELSAKFWPLLAAKFGVPVSADRHAVVSGTHKTDIVFYSPQLGRWVGVGVYSSSTANFNHAERHWIDEYEARHSLPGPFVKLLKLFTGETPPSSASSDILPPRTELADPVRIGFSEFSKEAQETLLNGFRSIRLKLISDAIFGRGLPLGGKNPDGAVDLIEVFAFSQDLDGVQKWIFSDAADVMTGILSTDVKKGARTTVALGHGVSAQRYGGIKAKDSAKLQIKVSPDILFVETQKFELFKPTADLFTIPQEDQDDAKTISISETHSAGAKRGFKAEKLLIERINERSPATAWVVEQAVSQVGYGDVVARKPGPRDKPDVILLQQEVVLAGISLKTFGPGTSSSNQVFRTPVDQYEREWDVPRDVAALIRNFVGIGESLSRVFFDEVGTAESTAVTKFFGQVQPHVVSSILAGKAGAALRADWMMLHEAADDKWHERVGNRDFWKMYAMARVIDVCCSESPGITVTGGLRLGLGLTMQRKGGDSGGPGANDLQFKMSPRAILVALANAG
jgi:hypothetical protein